MKARCIDWNAVNNIIEHREMSKRGNEHLLRRYIAELLGWSKIKEGEVLTGEHPSTECIMIPHFDWDYDACRRAERYIFDKDRILFDKYVIHLIKIVMDVKTTPERDRPIVLHIATPKERCKAIVLTTSEHVRKCRSCKRRILSL